MCNHCNREVEIVDSRLMGGNVIQVLSCGHSINWHLPSAYEQISAAAKVISPLKIAKIEPLASGTIPVNVSGEALPKTPAFLDISGLEMRKEGNVFVVNGNPIIYVNSPHTETMDVSSTTVINNLNDIFMHVDKANHSDEEKSKIKEILSILHKEKDTKLVTEIISSSLHHLKSWLPVDTPYVTMYLGTLS